MTTLDFNRLLKEVRRRPLRNRSPFTVLGVSEVGRLNAGLWEVHELSKSLGACSQLAEARLETTYANFDLLRPHTATVSTSLYGNSVRDGESEEGPCFSS